MGGREGERERASKRQTERERETQFEGENNRKSSLLFHGSSMVMRARKAYMKGLKCGKSHVIQTFSLQTFLKQSGNKQTNKKTPNCFFNKLQNLTNRLTFYKQLCHFKIFRNMVVMFVQLFSLTYGVSAVTHLHSTSTVKAFMTQLNIQKVLNYLVFDNHDDNFA